MWAQSFVIPDIGSRNAALTTYQAPGWSQEAKYTVWLERGHLWFSRFDTEANTWADTAIILDVHGATDLQLISGPSPVDGGVGYLVAVWLEGVGNASDAFYALGVARNNGTQVDWTPALQLNQDGVNDRRIVAEYGRPGSFGYLLEKVDSSDSEDDGDIYFGFLDTLLADETLAKPLPPVPPDLIPTAPDRQWNPNGHGSHAVFADLEVAPPEAAVAAEPSPDELMLAGGGLKQSGWPLDTQFGVDPNVGGEDGFSGNEFLEKLKQIKSLANAVPKDVTFDINARGGGAEATSPEGVTMDGKFKVLIKVPLLGGKASAGDQQITENTSGELSAMAYFKALVRTGQAYDYPEDPNGCLEYDGVAQGLDFGADLGVEAKMAIGKVFSAKISLEAGLMLGLLFDWQLEDGETDDPLIGLVASKDGCPTWADRYAASWESTPEDLMLTMVPFTELAGLDLSKYDFEESTKLYLFFKATASVNLIKILRVKGSAEVDVGYVFNPNHHTYEHVDIRASARIAFITVSFEWTYDNSGDLAELVGEPQGNTSVSHDPLDGRHTVHGPESILTGSGGSSNLLEDEHAALAYLGGNRWAAAWVEHESTGNAAYPLSRIKAGVFETTNGRVDSVQVMTLPGSEGLNTGLVLESRLDGTALAAWSHADSSSLSANSSLADVQAVAEQTDLYFATLSANGWGSSLSHPLPGADGHPAIAHERRSGESLVAWINHHDDGRAKIHTLRTNGRSLHGVHEVAKGFFETTELQIVDSQQGSHLSWTEEYDSSYSGEVLFSDPEIYLRFDEKSRHDPAHNHGSLGSVANGSYRGPWPFVQMGKPGALRPGDNNTAIRLGLDLMPHVEVPHQSALSSDSFSVEVWARQTSPTENRAGIAVKEDEWYLITPTGYRVRFSAGASLDGSDLRSGEITANLPEGHQDWHHIVGTYDARSQVAALYIDGELVASRPVRRLGRNNKKLVIGGDNGWSGFNQGFGGDLDEFAFYGRALDAEEIRRHFDARTVEPEKNKVSRGLYSIAPAGTQDWHEPERFEVGLVRPETHTGDMLKTPTTNTDDIDSGYIVHFRDSKTAGRALATGDFNHDGNSDFAIGDPGEGVVYVALGGPDLQGDLTAEKLHRHMDAKSNLVIVRGPTTWSHFGASLAAADLNGDQLDDLVIGAPEDNLVYLISGQQLQGVVDLGNNRFAATVSTGPAGSKQYGYSVATGDIDGDGNPEVLVGAPGSNQGAGIVYRLQDGGPLPHNAQVLFQGQTSTLQVSDKPGNNTTVTVRPRVGHAVAISQGSNTFSGNSNADVVIGAPGAMQAVHLAMSRNAGGQMTSSGSNRVTHAMAVGKAYVLLGADANNVLTLTHNAPDPMQTGGKEGTHDWAAGSALTFGDFNGDSIDDLVVGAPGFQDSQGVSYILLVGSRQSGSLDLRTDHDVAVHGVSAMDSSGKALSHGDLNQDSKTDLMIASPTSAYSTGQAHVAFGRSNWDATIDLAPGAVDHTMVLKGGRPHVASGIAILGTGDLNGDNYSDLVTSAPYAQQVYVAFGHPYLVHGASIDLMKLRDDNGFIIEGPDIHGRSLGYVGDVNGDGFTDAMADTVLILGDSTEALLKGATDTGHAIQIPFPHPNEDSVYGPPFVSSIGRDDIDLNGDGYSDFVLEAATGEYHYDFYDHRIVFGGPDPRNLKSSGVFCSYDLRFWCRVISAGDLNGDGYADLAAMVFNLPLTESNCGGVWDNQRNCISWIGIVPGGPDLANRSKIRVPLDGYFDVPTYELEGQYAVEPIGDIDGDGKDDLFVWINGSHQGHWILFGQSDLSQPARTYSMSYLAGGITAAGKLGNLNNSETDEWFVLNSEGLVVFQGTSPIDTLSGATRGGASLGDINGDGYGDFAYGKSADEVRVIYGEKWMNGSAGFDLGKAAGFTIQVPGATSPPLANRLGDMNGDGFDDFGIASSFDQASFVFFGGDFTNRRVLEGTIANDVLRGDGDSQSILTGVGNDYILTSNGNDGVYYGGTENDVIAIGGHPPRLIDGGWGLDILRPRGHDVWNKVWFENRQIAHMEILDLNHYGAQRIDVDAETFDRLLDMSVERQLVIRGDDDDRVVLEDSGLVNHGYVSFQGQSLLKVAKDGVGTLLIEPEIVEFP